jgi:hypothetical protein
MCPARDQQFYVPQMRLSEQHGGAGYSANATNSIFVLLARTELLQVTASSGPVC